MFFSTAHAKDRLAANINYFIKKKLPDAEIGIVVAEAKNGRILYQRNPNAPFTPASTAKLFSTTAALKYLKSNFRYRTTLSINKKQLKGNTLYGNLYVTFSGDPTLSTNELKKLIAGLSKKGIKRIKGNIILDTQAFSGPEYPLGWPHDDLKYCYGAPVTSIVLNENCMHVNLKANKSSKHKPKISFGSDGVGFRVYNNVRYAVKKDDLKTCVFEPEMDGQLLKLDGCLPHRKYWRFGFAVTEPEYLAKHIIRAAIKKEKVIFSGHIINGKSPKGLSTIAINESPGLKSLSKEILQKSDNLYAEALTKSLGQAYYGVGSTKAGVNAISQVLKSTGINFNELTLEDGSGLSSYNLISPKQFYLLLLGIKKQPKLFMIMKQLLPYSGISGTLAHRMKTKYLKRKVFAKTGAISGVSNIAGYLKKGNRTLIVVIMVRYFKDDKTKVRPFQDALFRLIQKYA